MIPNYNREINSDNATRCEAADMDANQVIARYANGERDFRLQDLKNLSFIHADLSGADFTGADLSGSDFSDSDLNHANFNWTNLKGANLSRTNLSGAKMPDGRTHNDYLESANYLGA
jgi:uncharacterized protein YjbI with pentapeptide repeats